MQRRRLTRPGRSLTTLSLVSATIVGLTIIGAASAVVTSSEASETTSNSLPDPPAIATPSPARVALMCGVTPTSAAVAGMNPAHLEAVFGYCAINTEPARRCLEIDAYLEELRRYSERVLRDMRIHGPDDALAQSLQEARSTIDALESEREGVFDELNNGLRAVLASQVGPHGVELIERFDENSARRVPEAYRCLALTGREWDTLAAAFDKRDINAAAAGHDAVEPRALTEEEQTVLGFAENSLDAENAAARLENGLTALVEAFESQHIGH